MIGRPCELTEEVIETVCAQVALGRSLALAAAAAGFSREAVKKWQRQGNADRDAGVSSLKAVFVTRLAGARGELSDMLTHRALQGLDMPGGQSNVRDTLSVLKTFLPGYYGERAADLDVQAELAVGAEEAETQSGGSSVTADVVRCGACGVGSAVDDAAKVPTYCAACGERLQAPG